MTGKANQSLSNAVGGNKAATTKLQEQVNEVESKDAHTEMTPEPADHAAATHEEHRSKDTAATTHTAASTGSKRKSTDSAEDVDLDEIDCEGMPITENADQVRRKIRRFIDNGGMKVGEFCNAIGNSNNSYNRFMKQSGPTKGLESEVYQNAWEFFKKREIAGLKMPTKKKAKTADAGSGAAPSKAKKDAGLDISSIQLDGEEADDVPVQDSCNEIRRKINAHLKKPGVTQAQFCRDLYSQLTQASAQPSSPLSSAPSVVRKVPMLAAPAVSTMQHLSTSKSCVSRRRSRRASIGRRWRVSGLVVWTESMMVAGGKSDFEILNPTFASIGSKS